jgi:N-acyl-D-amino-acid deacylase
LGLASAASALAQSQSPDPAAIFDPVMVTFLEERSTPGGALAVAKNGRVIYTRGYGWADREKKIKASADTLFRIASLSKPITAVAVLKLVEQERLNLEDHPYELLKLHLFRPAETTLDERWKQITIRHLLQHTAGWDRNQSFDPMFRPTQIAAELKAPSPASAWSVIRYMLGQPLDFSPGERYAYSNFGYCLLGRVIEQVTKQRYEAYLRQTILAPLGIRHMRIGDSRRSAPGEAHYYLPTEETTTSVFDPNEKVSWPYGGFYLEAMDAHGGWIASPSELIHFAAAADSQNDLLRAETRRLAALRPEGAAGYDKEGKPTDKYYGLGWMMRPVSGGSANWWHTGSLPGTYTLMVRRHDGICYVAMFNQRSSDQSADAVIDPRLYDAADRLSVET